MISATIRINPNKNVLKNLSDKKRWNEFIQILLENMGNEGIREIKMRAATAFKNPKGGYIAGVQKEVSRGRLRIWTAVPYAKLYEYGAPERPMTWLIKPYPISFTLQDGTKITRYVRKENIGKPSNTAKSGKSWTYPEVEAKLIFTKSFEAVIKLAQEKLKTDFVIKIAGAE